MSEIQKMATETVQEAPKYISYSKSKVPVLGALIDYVDTSVKYLRLRTLAQAGDFYCKPSKETLSTTFLASVCLLLGLTSCIKFEVVTFDNDPLPNDLHFMLLSKEDNIYIDDIDMSRVKWCLDASDLVVMLISCLLIYNSSKVRPPLCEYCFLPWLGATLRGMFLRQAPTASALIYTQFVVTGYINPLFLTAFSILLLLEASLWLEVFRLVHFRWTRFERLNRGRCQTYELETLWSNADVQSIEVHNFIY